MSPTSARLPRPAPGLCVLLAIASLAVWPAAAQSSTALIAPLHGGVVTETESHIFETVIARDGVHVWFFTDESAPAMIGRATGTASLKLPNGQVREAALTLRAPATDGAGVFFCPMHAEVVQKTPGECEPCGGMILFHQDELFGAVDLSGRDLAAVTAQIRLSGLKGRQKEATFSPAFPLPDVKAAPQTPGK